MNCTLSTFRSATLFFILCIGHFYVDSMLGIWPIWKTLAGYDILTAGIVTGISVLFGESMQSVFGSLSDRGWSKKLLIGALVLSCIALLFPFVSFPLASFFYFLVCVASAAIHPTAVSLVSSLDVWKGPLMMSLFQTAGYFGFAASQKMFINAYSYSPYALFVFAVCPLVLIFALCKVPIPCCKIVREKISIVRSVVLLWRKRPLKLLYLTLVLTQSVFWSVLFFLPESMLEKKADPWLCLGGGCLVFVLGAACASILCGFLASRIDIPRLLFFLCACAATVLTVWTTCSAPCVWVQSVLLFILGGALGAISPLVLFLGTSLEQENRGMVSAFLMGGVWIVSETCGYILSSCLYSLVPSPCALNTLTIFVLFLLLACIVQILFYKSAVVCKDS